MSIEVNGKVYRNLPEQVEENANNIVRLLAIIESMGNIMRYKGSVPTYADLPTEDNAIGDVYNVIATGVNYAWDGEGWDELGSVVDLSGYVEKISVAPEYDDTLTYALGALVFYEGTLYECTTAVTVAEAFDPAKWTATSLDSIIESIKSSFGNYVDLTSDQTISGVKTFSSGIKLNQNAVSPEIQWNDITSRLTVGELSIAVGGNETYSSSHFIPYLNNTYDLGSSTYKWKDLYLSGIAYAGSLDLGNGAKITKDSSDRLNITNGVGASVKVKVGSNETLFATRLSPDSTNSYDLGRRELKWRHLSLSGLINPNASDYGLALPDTSGYTASKTIATTDQLRKYYRHNIRFSFTANGHNWQGIVNIPYYNDTAWTDKNLLVTFLGSQTIVHLTDLTDKITYLAFSRKYSTYYEFVYYSGGAQQFVDIDFTDATLAIQSDSVVETE